MTTVSGSFTTVEDVSSVLVVQHAGENVDIALSGTYNMSIQLERAVGGGDAAWEVVAGPWTTEDATVAEVYVTEKINERLRLRVTVDTSGTAVYSAAFTPFASVPATDAEIQRVADVSSRLISLEAASQSILQETHEGRTCVFNKADGCTAILPAATGSGAKYTFIVGTAVSGGDAVIDAGTNGGDLEGVAFGSDDEGEPSNGWVAGAANDEFHMDGTTQGGGVGDWIEVVDIATNRWAIRATITQTGTEATPFEGS